MIIAVIGVSGSGKSTLGGALGEALHWTFVEGDDFHPPENVAKMRRRQPLDEADRGPWLAAIHHHLLALDRRGQDAVLACSALKKSHRATLAAGLRDIRFVYLCGDPELIRRRMRSRSGHFMPADLLDSQIAALEPPLDALLIPIDLSTEAQVAQVVGALNPEHRE